MNIKDIQVTADNNIIVKKANGDKMVFSDKRTADRIRKIVEKSKDD